jgi:hypothetical protein
LSRQKIKVAIDGAAHSLNVRPGISDMDVVRQVFENQDYNTDRLGRGPELRGA